MMNQIERFRWWLIDKLIGNRPAAYNLVFEPGSQIIIRSAPSRFTRCEFRSGQRSGRRFRETLKRRPEKREETPSTIE